METAINYASANGMYVIVDSHDFGSAGFSETYSTNLWTYVAPHFAGRTHVIYEIANEAIASFDGSGVETPARRATELKRVFDVTRAGAPDTHIMVLTPPGVTDGGSGLGFTALAASFDAATSTPVDWTKTSVSYHLYNTNGATLPTETNLVVLHEAYPAFPSENNFPASVTDATLGTTDGRRSGNFGTELYVTQTSERLGTGWSMWNINGPVQFAQNFPVLLADATPKGYAWQDDLYRQVANIDFAAVTPSVDGIMENAWSAVTAHGILKYPAEPGSVADSDISGTWRSMYDATNLYFFVDVQDDVLINDSGGEWYYDDAVEIYIDGDNSHTGTYDANDHQFVFRWNNSGIIVNPTPVAAGIVFTRVATLTGYRFEVKFPWTLIGGVGVAGEDIGLDVMLIDDDDGGNREHKRSWQSPTDNAWNNPSVFGAAVMQAANTTVPYVAKAPTVDGTAETAWNASAMNAIDKLVAGSAVPTSDISGNWRSLWDQSNLYIFADITDNVKIKDSVAFSDDDTVEIYLDADNSGLVGYGINDLMYSFRWNDLVVHESKNNQTTGVTFSMVATATGYRLEAKFPFSTLGMSAANASRLGIEVMVADDDVSGAQDNKLAWFGSTDEASQNPSLFGAVDLVGAPTVSPPVASPPGGEIITATNVSLSTTTAGASIRYTTDGTTIPTSTVGMLYTGAPITISSTTTLQSIAYLAGEEDSVLLNEVYTFVVPVSTVRVNVGGPAVAPFDADFGFSASNIAGPGAAVSTAGVANAAPASVYDTERYAGASMTFTSPRLTAGQNYDIRLHFAERYVTAADQRLFDISVNGATSGAYFVDEYDVYAVAGQQFKAVVVSFSNVPLNGNNRIEISFNSGVIQSPMVNGIEIIPANTAFPNYQAANFTAGELADESISGALADPLGDGVTNLIKFASNIPAKQQANTLTLGSGTSGLPASTFEDVGNGSKLLFEFIRIKSSNNPGITYIPEFSTDLISWSSTVVEVSVTSIDATFERVRVRQFVLTLGADQVFARLRVTQP